MIRPLTFITALMFVLSGAYLFAVTHRGEVLNDELAATAQATRQDEARIRVLQAQWALEADPSRLAQLAGEFTKLQPMQPVQLVSLATLTSVLPPPGSLAPGEAPAPLPAPTAVVAAAGVAPPAVAPASMVPPPVQKFAGTQSVLGQAAQPAGLQAVALFVHALPSAPRPARVHHDAVAHVFAASRPVLAPAPSALSAQTYASVQAPPAMLGAPVRAVSETSATASPTASMANAVPSTPPMPAYNGDGGSLLGMAQSGSSN